MLKSASCVLATLLTVGIPRPALSQQEPQRAPVTFIEVSLVCPVSKDSGTLEMDSQNQSGKKRRVLVVYRSARALSVEIFVAPPGEEFKPFMYVEISKETDPDNIDIAKVFSDEADRLKNGVCEGTADAKRRYFTTLDANKASLR